MKKTSYIDSAKIISRLDALAHNLWWSWNPRAQSIFQELSPLVWETSNHNPVVVLTQCSQMELQAYLGDEQFRERVVSVLDDFDAYMHQSSLLGKKDSDISKTRPVAYFCAEFGI